MQASELPFYPRVPKHYYRNLQFRREVLRACLTDVEARKQQIAACKRDILYFIAVFGWAFDPFILKHPAIPIVLYPYQEETILKIQSRIGRKDLLIVKSRDMFASWMILLAKVHFWRFFGDQKFLEGSRTEDYVDSDDKSMFWKLRHFISHLPKWLQPRWSTKYMLIENEDNGSTFSGESTNPNFGRGARKTAIGLDEFASVLCDTQVVKSTQATTPCRIFNSTPQGIDNQFSDLRHGGKVEVIELHWTKHPVFSRGLYYDENGKPRSPWYDAECARAPSLQFIAQELDMDFSGSESMFFDSLAIQSRMDACEPPVFTGMLDFDPGPCIPRDGFQPRENGEFELWEMPDEKGRLKKGEYALGIDVAVGTAGPTSSYSVISFGRYGENNKVGQFASRSVSPVYLANLAIALARWLDEDKRDGCYIIFESNGSPGQQFAQEVMRQQYYNVYYKTREDSVTGKVSDSMGFFTSANTKAQLMGEYSRSLTSGTFVNPSRDALAQCLQYVIQGDKIVHSLSRNKDNQAGLGYNHGDHVIADALLRWAFFKWGEEKKVEPKEEEPISCLKFRRDARRLRERRSLKSRWVAA